MGKLQCIIYRVFVGYVWMRCSFQFLVNGRFFLCISRWLFKIQVMGHVKVTFEEWRGMEKTFFSFLFYFRNREKNPLTLRILRANFSFFWQISCCWAILMDGIRLNFWCFLKECSRTIYILTFSAFPGASRNVLI